MLEKSDIVIKMFTLPNSCPLHKKKQQLKIQKDHEDYTTSKGQGNSSIHLCNYYIQLQSTFHLGNHLPVYDRIQPSAAVSCSLCQLDPLDNKGYP